MTDPSAKRAHSLFVQALELEAGRRGEFLVDACGGDADLRSRVDRLLAASARSTTFLETPALHAPPAAPPSVRGYRVGRLIAAGGMAAVYEATQEQPPRRVALKVMNRALTHTSAVRRFRFETEVLARLRHPGIAQIFDAGTCDAGQGNPVPFFAMEFVEGAKTLVDHAGDARLTLRDRLLMFVGVCDAVEHGHQQGVIHRDLKPGNILVGADGATKVIDYGVARSIDADQDGITRRADVGQLIGTLNYMSPEQCSSDGRVDLRADVYSLGVILYQLVTGRPPYDLGSVTLTQAIRTIVEGRPVRAGSLVPAARGDLDAIISMAMEKVPSNRYGSAGALAADIRRFLSHEPTTARPPTIVRQARLFAVRHRVLSSAALIVSITLLAAGVLTTRFALKSAREARDRLKAQNQALLERDAARRASYSASVSGALASYHTRDFAHAAARLASAPPELRNWEWSYVSAMVDQGERVVEAHGDMIFSLAITADGRRLATGSRDGSVALWDAEFTAPLHRFDGLADAAIYSVAFSTDGKLLAAASADHTVRVLDAETLRELCIYTDHSAIVESVAGGARHLFASASSDGVARVWQGDTGQEIRLLSDRPGDVHGVAYSRDGGTLITWNHRGTVRVHGADGETRSFGFGGRVDCAAMSPDGVTLAAGGAEGRIRLWDSVTGEDLGELSSAPIMSGVRSLAFSPRGDRLVAGQIDRSITIWDVATRERHSSLLGHSEAVSGLAATDSRIYSASWDRTIRVWPADPSQGGQPLSAFDGHSNTVRSVAFSPDGSLVASGSVDKTVRLWDSSDATILRTLGARASVFSVVIAPDGESLAAGCYDGNVRRWSARTGEPLPEFDTGGQPIWSVAFSPDGSLLASGGDDKAVHLCALPDMRPGPTLRGHEARVTAVAFRCDGTMLASASRDGTVRLWDVATGAQLHRLPGHTLDVYAVVFSHDGALLYSGSRDQTVRIWDTATGDCKRVLGSGGHLISSLSLSPDGTRLAAGSWFGEIIVWDVAAGEIALSFRARENSVRTVAFSPDGRSLLCGGLDPSLRLFQAIPRNERAASLDRNNPRRSAAAEAIEQLHGTPAQLADTVRGLAAKDPDMAPWLWKALLSRCGRQAP